MNESVYRSTPLQLRRVACGTTRTPCGQDQPHKQVPARYGIELVRVFTSKLADRRQRREEQVRPRGREADRGGRKRRKGRAEEGKGRCEGGGVSGRPDAERPTEGSGENRSVRDHDLSGEPPDLILGQNTTSEQDVI